MSQNFKKVPAIEKCFSILSLLAEAERPLGYSEIVRKLELNKSTVFNILHTLAAMDILEKGPDGLFRLGSRLFILGNAAANGSELIQSVHPYLETVNNEFKLSAFFGILSDMEVMIVDKADRANRIKISSEVGMRMPILAGVAGKALLAQLPEDTVNEILSELTPKRYTKNTIISRDLYKQEILNVKNSGIAYDREEYIEGLVAVAVPFNTYREDLKTVIWAVGLKQELKDEVLRRVSSSLLDVANQLNHRFSIMTGPIDT